MFGFLPRIFGRWSLIPLYTEHNRYFLKSQPETSNCQTKNSARNRGGEYGGTGEERRLPTRKGVVWVNTMPREGCV